MRKIIFIILLSLFTHLSFSQTTINGGMKDKVVFVETVGSAEKKKEIIDNGCNMVVKELILSGVSGFNDGKALTQSNLRAGKQETIEQIVNEASVRFLQFQSSKIISGYEKNGKSFQAKISFGLLLEPLIKLLIQSGLREVVEVSTPKAFVPSICIAPFVDETEKETYKKLFSNPNIQTISSSITQQLLKSNIETMDILAMQKVRDKIQMHEFESSSSTARQMLMYSGPDVLFEFSYNVDTPDNRKKRVRVTLKAYDTNTGVNITNITKFSMHNAGTNYVEQLAASCIKQMFRDKKQPGSKEDIWNDSNLMMQVKNYFNNLETKGMDISVSFSLDAASSIISFQDKFGSSNKTLAAFIDERISSTCFENNYHAVGYTDTSILYDKVKIPVGIASEKTKSIFEYQTELVDYMTNQVGVECRTSIDGRILMVTLLNEL